MNPQAPLPFDAPTEPDPKDWLTDERRQQLIQLISSARPFLIQAGLWRSTLTYWVREQASLEASWDPEAEKKKIDELEEQWHAREDSVRKGLNSAMLRAKLRVAPAIALWSREQWGHRLDSLFLKSKSQLDRASCRLIRVRDKHLANELYHRIKAGETSFEAVARDFGEGAERHQGGLIPMQPLRLLPFGLAPVLEHLEPGQFNQPMRLGNGFCLVELIDFQDSQLDEATAEELLAIQLKLWINSVVDVLEADLSL